MLDAQSRVGPCEQRRNSSESEPVKWTERGSVVSNTQIVLRIYATAGPRLDNVWLDEKEGETCAA